MANPTPVPVDSIFPRASWLRIDKNNFQLDPDDLTCQNPIFVAILRGHPLWKAFHATTSVPEVYLQQFWHTLRLTGNHLTAQIGPVTVRITQQTLRNKLFLPLISHYPNKANFDVFRSETQICTDISSLGYHGALNRLMDFKRMNLAQPWQTLFLFVNKCLSPKHSGFDKANHHIFRIFHGVAFNLHYDFAQCIWDDILELLRKETTNLKAQVVPYLRFFALIIRNFMRHKPEIYRRGQSEKLSPFNLKFIRPDQHELPVPAMVIPEVLLQMADQTDLDVTQYRGDHQLIRHSSLDDSTQGIEEEEEIKRTVTEDDDEEDDEGEDDNEEDQDEDDGDDNDDSSPPKRRSKSKHDSQTTTSQVARALSPPSHSPAPQQVVISSMHGESLHVFLTPHSEGVEIEIIGSLPHSTIPPTGATPVPTLNIGHPNVTDSTAGSTERDPEVMPELVSRAYFDQALKAVQNSFERQFLDVKKLLKGKGVMPDESIPQKPPKPPAAPQLTDLSVDELKQLLLSKLIEQAKEAPANADLVALLRSQATLAATKEDFNTILVAISRLSERISILEQTCKSLAQGIKRGHDDHDHDHHEGEKRRRLNEDQSRGSNRALHEEIDALFDDTDQEYA